MNPIVYATPVFFALIGLELWQAHRRKARAYDFADTLCSIGLGAVSQVTEVFSKALMLGIYVLVYEHLLVRPTDLSRVNAAFFNVNAVISIGLFVVGTIDLLT